MEHQRGRGNPTTGRTTQCLTSDMINNLPQDIIGDILSRIPLRDALRTSVLSKKWRYNWRSIHLLEFTDNMVTVPSDRPYTTLMKYKLVSAIFHVLLFHNGPKKLVFRCSVVRLHMESEFAQMISYLAKGNTLKCLVFFNDNQTYKLPHSLFSLQGLQFVSLNDCTLEPPVTFNGFSSLSLMSLVNVEVSAQMLQQILSKCPMLKYIHLDEDGKDIDSAAGGNMFRFVDLLPCVPLIEGLNISKYYMKHLCAGGMPHKLPASLVHLKYLFLEVCLVERNEISSVLCIIRSSPVLEKISFMMYDNEKVPVRQTPTNFLDPEGHPDLNLDHLETFVIKLLSSLPIGMEFVKLILAKSPVLKNVQIEFNDNVSVDEALKLLEVLARPPFPPASPSATLTFVCPYDCV